MTAYKPMGGHVVHGFSLLEILTVIFIVSVLAATAYPSFSKYIYKARISEAIGQTRQWVDLQVQYALNDHLVISEEDRVANYMSSNECFKQPSFVSFRSCHMVDGDPTCYLRAPRGKKSANRRLVSLPETAVIYHPSNSTCTSNAFLAGFAQSAEISYPGYPDYELSQPLEPGYFLYAAHTSQSLAAEHGVDINDTVMVTAYADLDGYASTNPYAARYATNLEIHDYYTDLTITIVSRGIYKKDGEILLTPGLFIAHERRDDSVDYQPNYGEPAPNPCDLDPSYCNQYY